ncbi:MAG: UDP-N-acetylmuramate--L-alanine ligase, partial [Betaproteobacteria bacterium]|nr:UDP-N-acetylmuramate--L-alanine ligase [Betaproteobacteria bacterium]
CIDDASVQEIVPRLTKPVLTYGFSANAELRAVNVEAHAGRMRFTAVSAKPAGRLSRVLDCELNLAGVHNVANALAVIAIAREIGIDDAHIVRGLASFPGVGRRFQRYGEIEMVGGSFTLIDDYGHHPAEMAAVLAAARGAFPERRILLAFQPHRYTRTRDLFEDFVKVLSTADAVVLADIYPAGETPIVAADGRALMRAIRVAGKVEPVFVDSATEMPEAIRAQVQPGDVVITMGAGSVSGVAQALAGGGGGE